MDNSGQITAPGRLESGAVIAPDAPKVPDQNLAELAWAHGLKLAGARPTLSAYILSLWQRRHFILGYATARNVSMYTDAKLGQLWQILTPLLNAGVYFLIFGILFGARDGITNYTAVLMAGVFTFAFTERSVVTGSNVMRANLQLVRALYFPRASLPLAYVIVELQQMLVGMGVLAVIMLATHESISWYWLLLIPAVLLQTTCNIGVALAVARLGGSTADASELIPFFLRITRYFCGVMYVAITLTGRLHHTWEKLILTLNPPAVFISLVRVAFMQTYRTQSAGNKPYNAQFCKLFMSDMGGKNVPGRPGMVNNALQAYCHPIVTNNDLWIAALAWGIGCFVIGIVFFWKAEHLYGRG